MTTSRKNLISFRGKMFTEPQSRPSKNIFPEKWLVYLSQSLLSTDQQGVRVILVQQTSSLESCRAEFYIGFGPIVSCLKEAGKSRKFFEDIIIDLNQEVWMNEKVAPDAATSRYSRTTRITLDGLLSRKITIMLKIKLLIRI